MASASAIHAPNQNSKEALTSLVAMAVLSSSFLTLAINPAISKTAWYDV